MLSPWRGRQPRGQAAAGPHAGPGAGPHGHARARSGPPAGQPPAPRAAAAARHGASPLPSRTCLWPPPFSATWHCAHLVLKIFSPRARSEGREGNGRANGRGEGGAGGGARRGRLWGALPIVWRARRGARGGSGRRRGRRRGAAAAPGSRGGRLPHTANHNNAHAPPAGASAKDAMVAGRRVIGSAAFGTHRSPRQPPWRPPRGRVPISCPAMIWPPS